MAIGDPPPRWKLSTNGVTLRLMALNLKNAEVERLVSTVAELAGESKTEAVRRSLQERLERLVERRAPVSRATAALQFLETEVWPTVPAAQRGRRLSRDEEDEILGYGPEGV